MRMPSCSLTAALLVVIAPPLFAADKKMQAKDLPAAVQAAVQESTRGATKQVTRGKAVAYEATVERNVRKSEFAVNADGTPVKS